MLGKSVARSSCIEMEQGSHELKLELLPENVQNKQHHHIELQTIALIDQKENKHLIDKWVGIVGVADKRVVEVADKRVVGVVGKQQGKLGLHHMHQEMGLAHLVLERIPDNSLATVAAQHLSQRTCTK